MSKAMLSFKTLKINSRSIPKTNSCVPHEFFKAELNTKLQTNSLFSVQYSVYIPIHMFVYIYTHTPYKTKRKLCRKLYKNIQQKVTIKKFSSIIWSVFLKKCFLSFLNTLFMVEKQLTYFRNTSFSKQDILKLKLLGVKELRISFIA